VQRTRYQYQEVGICFGSYNRRVIVADDLGLGKSSQALGIVDTCGCEHVLIIALNSTLLNWVDEIGHWSRGETALIKGKPALRAKIIHGAQRFTLINYEMVPKHATELAKIKWDGVIVDEAHKIRNRASKTFKAVAKVTRDYSDDKVVVALTGTPIFNRIEDLWSILHVVDAKKFSSFWKWAEANCKMAANPYSRYPQPVGPKNPEQLKYDLSEIVIRRLKSDASIGIQLPQKTIVPIGVPLSDEQHALYKQIVDEYVIRYRDMQIDVDGELAVLTRLKQLCISPDLLLPPVEDEYLSGPKIDAIIDLIESSGDQKVIVFSQFARVVEGVYRRIRGDYPAVIFTGHDAIEERHKTLKKLPDNKVLLTTMQSGGVGLNMTAASVAIFPDLMWAPANNNQALDRIHRIGQTRNVTAYALIALASVEESILKTLHRKEALFDAVVPEYEIIKAARQSLADARGIFQGSSSGRVQREG
jgi:SNF2 family DNA or RNA helicase